MSPLESWELCALPRPLDRDLDLDLGLEGKWDTARVFLRILPSCLVASLAGNGSFSYEFAFTAPDFNLLSNGFSNFMFESSLTRS